MRELVITDPLEAPELEPNALERWFLPRLRDPRDLVFVRQALKFTAIFWVSGLVYFSGLLPAWTALLWIPALFATQAGPFTLMLHAVCHRKLFKGQHGLLNAWIPWALGPFVGHTPDSFYNHHVGMHHPENNAFSDLSTTIGYQRDRPGHFLRYWARFFVFGTAELLTYHWTRRRKKLFWSMVKGELAWYLGVALLLLWKPAAALVVFVIPFLLIRVLMMSGNFAQHSFIDVDDPTNSWRNSTCLLNARYNHKCWNDGYHIVHHLKPTLHWTEMAAWFRDNLEEFGRNDAVVFDGLGNNQTVWWCLMTQQWGRLADHLVDLPGAPVRSREEKIAFLQDRVRRTAGEPTPLLRGALPEGEALAAK